MGKKTILMVDDEIGISELVQMYLEKKGYIVKLANNGEKALDVVASVSPDLVLLDIEMPGIDGFEVCREIRKKMSIPIIFLSVRRDVIDKVKCFELGGDDYVTKPFNYEELEARIKANLRRYDKIHVEKDPDILTYGKLTINLNNNICCLHGQPVPLSAKEFQLLVLLAEHPNRIWSPEQLYDNIWGLDSIGDIQTIKVHISYLRRKLEEDATKPKFIKTVRGFGYLFAAE